jgi:aspartate carbamoyltransferase catalytic subunit
MPTRDDGVRDFLGLEGVSAADLTSWLDEAEAMLPIASGSAPPPSPPPLRGRIVGNLFFEDSTRTRCSFEIAAKRLGADVVNLGASGSSASKGETILDTARNIEAMGVDAIVVRTSISGGAALLARHLRVPVINAGDGRHEHPTQGLLDLLSLRRHFAALNGRCELAGRTVAIVGDILHSRVARSATHGLVALGARVLLVGPPTLVGPDFTTLAQASAAGGSIEVGHDLDAVLGRLDAIMMLRVQLERDAGNAIAPDFRAQYGLTADRAARLPPHAAILHPGPVNRGVEIDDSVADDPRASRIMAQVTAGVATRMAVLRRVLCPD